MQYIKKYNKKIIFVALSIFIVPIALTLFNASILTIFNLGNYVGTFIRYLFNIIVC